MIHVGPELVTELLQALTLAQLRLLTTDTKVEVFKELCGTRPATLGYFLDASPQEQASHLYKLMHPEEKGVEQTEDRLLIYAQLCERLRESKMHLDASLNMLFNCPDVCAIETLEQMRFVANELLKVSTTLRNELHNVIVAK